MHAYRTSIHESTGYSPFRLMMGEECSLPQDVSTAELRTNREYDVSPHPFATWVWDALEVAYDHVRESLHRTEARRKRLYDTKAVNRKFPVGSWVLRYYPPAAQHKLGSPWIGPHQVVRQATSHTVGIQKDPEKPIVFVHVDDLKLCPGPQDISWVPHHGALCIRRTRTEADGRGRTRTDADICIKLYIFFFFFFLAYIDLRGQLERDPESDRLGPPPPTHHDLMKIY